MGYRSDVRMVIHGPREVILREFANLRLTGDKGMQEVLDEWCVQPDWTVKDIEYAVAILGQGGVSWKWYDAYPDVQAHTEIFDHFRELSEGAESESLESKVDGAFVRIGEDDDDAESEYFGEDPYDLANISRSIYSQYDERNLPDLRPRLTKSGA